MRWLTCSLADTDRHVIGCRLTQATRSQSALVDVLPSSIVRHVIGFYTSQDTRVQNALGDVASTTCQALGVGSGVGVNDRGIEQLLRRRGRHERHRRAYRRGQGRAVPDDPGTKRSACSCIISADVI